MMFTSCEKSSGSSSQDEPSENDRPSSMTVEESKEFLEQTALDAMKLFKVSDHESTIRFCQDIAERYGDLEMPDEWYDDDANLSPAAFARNLAEGLSSGNPSKIRSGASTYIYEFGKYTGIYEPGSTKWLRSGSSKDIVFKFVSNGKDCELIIKAEGQNADVKYEDNDNYYEEDNETIIVKLPKTITFELKNGTEKVAYGTINVNVDQAARTASINTDVTVANLRLLVDTSATDTELSETETMIVAGTPFVTYKTSLSGNGLCDQNRWEEIENNPNANKYNNMFKNGNASVDLLGKVQIKSKVSGAGSLYEAMQDGTYFDSYDYSSQKEAKRACQELCDVMNQYIVANMYYNNSNSVEGSVVFQPALYDYYYDWEYSPEVTVVFADDSRYSIDEYFDTFSFESVEKQFEILKSNYERIWR